MNNNTANFPLLCIADPQHALAASLAERNLKHFQLALNLGADPNRRDSSSSNQSVFEHACQSAGCSSFIVECLKHHADVQQPNADGRYPIHHAAASLDVENIRALLDHSETIGLDVQYQQRTALHLLFESINDGNWRAVFGCVQLLIDRGANVNVPNEDNRSALGVFVRDSRRKVGTELWREEVVRYCLKAGWVDVDSFRRGELRKQIGELFPGVSIPVYVMEANLNALLAAVKSRNEGKFDLVLAQYRDKVDEATRRGDFGVLLEETVLTGRVSFVEKVLSEDFVFEGDSGVTRLLETCCNRGFPDLLKFLLSKCGQKEDQVRQINASPLLSQTIREMNIQKDNRKCPFFKCFNILLEDGRVEIDKVDEKGFSALHYAVKYKVDAAVELLLQCSAYIGTLNMFKELPICEMDPDALEGYLDSCITTNEKRPGDDDYEISIDFSCLVPPTYKKNFSEKKQPPPIDEMLPIVYMSNSNDLKHLLKHPVISSYVLIKWLRLSIYFYVNLLVCTVFFASFTGYVVGCYGQDNVTRWLKETLRCVSLLGATYMLLRELGQMILHSKTYFRSLENWMELSLIALSYTVLLKEFQSETRQIISAIVILLSAVEFTLLVGTLPVLSISTHMVMLKTVSKNFLKSLVLYSIILISFAFCFYTLFNVNNARSAKDGSGGDAEGESDDEKFNGFSGIQMALLKTFVMLTGEFEAANIKFQNNGLSYIIFLLFLFFVAIVIFNLMNGLAVSDTAAIKAEAELIGLSQKVDVISKYENAIKAKSTGVFTNLIFSIFRSNFLHLFPEYLPCSQVIVKPNQSNAIYIPKPLKPSETESVIDVETQSHIELMAPGSRGQEQFKLTIGCCILPSFSRMDGKIMKYAKEIIHTKSRKGATPAGMVPLEQRMIQLERRLDLILQKLNIASAS
ncbi:transient receptor potential cation channel protein painless [Culex quinquefasciatus]|uniref:Transient receptor potential cation channel protein painless n=2 Tax=Culex pipiens complex TaxID=518105 RepID=B0WK88_CULQU|nr:transient receptor potential cation channel protein painless [Culex quinquefasciatus]|eukprot:XP_001849122.1 transient receptor potential cation channel protein painless [Culex quinquefasciatus]